VAEQGVRKTRIGFDYSPEVPAGEPEAPRGALRHDFGGSRTGVQDGDLAEEVACRQCGDRSALPVNACSSVQDHEQIRFGRACVHDRVTGQVLARDGRLRQGSKASFRDLGKQGDHPEGPLPRLVLGGARYVGDRHVHGRHQPLRKSRLQPPGSPARQRRNDDLVEPLAPKDFLDGKERIRVADLTLRFHPDLRELLQATLKSVACQQARLALGPREAPGRRRGRDEDEEAGRSSRRTLANNCQEGLAFQGLVATTRYRDI